MRKLAALAGVAALGLSAQAAFGYSASGTVTFNFGGSSAGASTDVAWTAQGVNTLSSMTNNQYFTTLGGYNSQSYYNADFASAGQCASIVAGLGGSGAQTRKYGCRYTSYSGNPSFTDVPVADTGALNGRATGSITVTDTSLIGTLTIVSTTDEPSGATTTFTSSGARVSNSVGNGSNGYNFRSADGSPFGNYWQGITTSGTLQVNLTGTFTSGSWSITGGTVAFSDSGFACQQGGNGSTSDAGAGTLCTRSSAAGGQQYNGAHLSWGWDIDGAGTGTTAISQIDVRDAAGVTSIASLSGVLASLSVSGGNVTTNSGEFRRALGSGSGCSNHIRYNGAAIACGTLTTGLLNITGSVTEAVVPVPAAVWLMGSALGLLGWMRRKTAA